LGVAQERENHAIKGGGPQRGKIPPKGQQPPFKNTKTLGNQLPGSDLDRKKKEDLVWGETTGGKGESADPQDSPHDRKGLERETGLFSTSFGWKGSSSERKKRVPVQSLLPSRSSQKKGSRKISGGGSNAFCQTVRCRECYRRGGRVHFFEEHVIFQKNGTTFWTEKKLKDTSPGQGGGDPAMNREGEGPAVLL